MFAKLLGLSFFLTFVYFFWKKKKRDELIGLCGNDSVPQIFFNENHIGGLKNLLNLQQNGSLHRVKKTK